LHKLLDNGHNPYLLIGYLPNEQLVLYGDMYNPPPGDDPRDLARTNEYAENLHDNIANRFEAQRPHARARPRPRGPVRESEEGDRAIEIRACAGRPTVPKFFNSSFNPNLQ
jgi:hypothetical protein